MIRKDAMPVEVQKVLKKNFDYSWSETEGKRLLSRSIYKKWYLLGV